MSTIDPLLGPKSKSSLTNDKNNSMQSASFVSKIGASSFNDIDIKVHNFNDYNNSRRL